MISEKRLGDAHDNYDRNGKKISPEEELTQARSKDIFVRPENSELNEKPTIIDFLILGTTLISVIGAIIYYFVK